MRIGNKNFDFTKKTYIMGILNVTPDSFSDGGTHNEIEQALQFAHKMVDEGADIIDVGGESTRPGHIQIGDEEEIHRVVPVIEAIKHELDVPVSIDTYKANVARAALEAGADMINDIWGFQYDKAMAGLAKEYDVAVCLMHNRETPQYANFLKEVVQDLYQSIELATQAGIDKDKIMIDPGVGFGKSYEQNLQIMNHVEKLVDMGYPVLLATSRKSVIGLTLDLPVQEREEGTLATSVLGAMKGCAMVRVHDVLKNVRALQMIDKIIRCE